MKCQIINPPLWYHFRKIMLQKKTKNPRAPNITRSTRRPVTHFLFFPSLPIVCQCSMNPLSLTQMRACPVLCKKTTKGKTQINVKKRVVQRISSQSRKR